MIWRISDRDVQFRLEECAWDLSQCYKEVKGYLEKGRLELREVIRDW